MTNALSHLTSLSGAERDRRGIRHTPCEIAGQVELWRTNVSLLEERREEIRAFIEPVLSAPRSNVILCGAGTSEFVGLCLEGLMQRSLGLPVRAVSTTRIVTTPADVFVPGWPTLLVSRLTRSRRRRRVSASTGVRGCVYGYALND